MAVAAVAGRAVPARAHHGFAGCYAFERPYYLAGRIESVWIGRPHVRLRLRLQQPLTLPGDRDPFRALEDAEARQMLGRLQPLNERGVIDVVMHGRLSRPLMNDPDALPEKSWTEMIAYRRVPGDEYREELMAVYVRLVDGRPLVASIRHPGRYPICNRN